MNRNPKTRIGSFIAKRSEASRLFAFSLLRQGVRNAGRFGKTELLRYTRKHRNTFHGVLIEAFIDPRDTTVHYVHAAK